MAEQTIDPGEGYRLLEEGETIQEGDEFRGCITLKWQPLTKAVGWGAGSKWADRMVPCRRKVEAPAPEPWSTFEGHEIFVEPSYSVRSDQHLFDISIRVRGCRKVSTQLCITAQTMQLTNSPQAFVRGAVAQRAAKLLKPYSARFEHVIRDMLLREARPIELQGGSRTPVETARRDLRRSWADVAQESTPQQEQVALVRCGCGLHDLNPAKDVYAQHRDWLDGEKAIEGTPGDGCAYSCLDAPKPPPPLPGPDMVGDDVSRDLSAEELRVLRARGVR